MDALTLWSLVGFLFAAYAVIANDSVQTLGTWIASNNERLIGKRCGPPLVRFYYGRFGMAGTLMAATYLMVG